MTFRQTSQFALSLSLALGACTNGNSSSPAETPTVVNTAEKSESKGVGPVTDIDVGSLDQGLVAKGKGIFESRCVACHKLNEKYVGPSLKGVTQRREAEWIMNMILNPSEMLQKDPVAKQLLAENLTQMANTSTTQDEARAILEYLRTIE